MITSMLTRHVPMTEFMEETQCDLSFSPSVVPTPAWMTAWPSQKEFKPQCTLISLLPHISLRPQGASSPSFHFSLINISTLFYPICYFKPVTSLETFSQIDQIIFFLVNVSICNFSAENIICRQRTISQVPLSMNCQLKQAKCFTFPCSHLTNSLQASALSIALSLESLSFLSKYSYLLVSPRPSSKALIESLVKLIPPPLLIGHSSILETLQYY